MSLLQQLQNKRNALKPTTTIVTTPAGARYIESVDDAATHIQLESNNYGFVVDTKPDPIPACILEDFLYLGSQDAVCMENVRDYKLTHILSVGIETPNLVDLETRVICKYLPCLDIPETRLFEDVLPEAINFIDLAASNSERVLVHCNAGVSRSASVVIAYLMLKRKMSYAAAYKLVKSQRACIQPNAGFREQLCNYDMKYN